MSSCAVMKSSAATSSISTSESGATGLVCSVRRCVSVSASITHSSCAADPSHISTTSFSVCVRGHANCTNNKQRRLSASRPRFHGQAQFTPDAEHLATCARTLWNTLQSIGVFTQLASNIKGFAHKCAHASCVNGLSGQVRYFGGESGFPSRPLAWYRNSHRTPCFQPHGLNTIVLSGVLLCLNKLLASIVCVCAPLVRSSASFCVRGPKPTASASACAATPATNQHSKRSFVRWRNTSCRNGSFTQRTLIGVNVRCTGPHTGDKGTNKQLLVNCIVTKITLSRARAKHMIHKDCQILEARPHGPDLVCEDEAI